MEWKEGVGSRSSLFLLKITSGQVIKIYVGKRKESTEGGGGLFLFLFFVGRFL